MVLKNMPRFIVTGGIVMADNARKNQKKTAPLGLVVFILIILINAFSEASPSSRRAMLPAVAAIGMIAVVTAVIIWAAKKAMASAGGTAAGTRSAADPHRHAAREAFPSPDAYCLVCDQTNVDHFERDRQRRLRQLDYWLSIGLIDRKEYRTLQARYNKSVPHSNG